MGRTIALATPVFFALIVLEYLWGRARSRNTYRLNDAINSLSLGVLSQLSGLYTRALRVGIYAFVYAHLAVFELPAGSPWVWALALLAYDFCYYWQHRVSHESALFWAAHVVHHQSQEFNLSTALRQTSTGALLGWIFYVPMAIAGVPPALFAVVALVDLLYQYWIHTEHVGRLGWIDRVLATPSNHRVHHAVNDGYVDRNYGGILIVWDRLFGSFVEERERCVYGTRAPLASWDPLWANLEGYAAIGRKLRVARGWRERRLAVFGAPGWQPAAAPPTVQFTLARVSRYDPPLSRPAALAASIGVALAIGGALPLLWNAANPGASLQAAGAGLVVLLLWRVGRLMQAPPVTSARTSAAAPRD
jgi:sterol desaturase/sphingolipid hydroxylase (fatty acid hydroxylase superfamily)